MHTGQRISKCKRCGRPTFWVKTVQNRRHPLDAEPVPDGPYCLAPSVSGDRIVHWTKFQAPDTLRYTSHFDTCPVPYTGPHYKTESSPQEKAVGE